MQTGDLCTVLGYLGTGRIVVMELVPDWLGDKPVMMVRIEISEGVIECRASEITSCRPAMNGRANGALPSVSTIFLRMHDIEEDE